LGWPLRIQKATRTRRVTAIQYLNAAGIAVRPPSGCERLAEKPTNGVISVAPQNRLSLRSPTATPTAKPAYDRSQVQTHSHEVKA